MRFLICALTMVCMLNLIGFHQVAAEEPTHTKDTLDMVKKALAENKAVLIDVREKSEWDQGHLQGAKLLPLSSLKDGALPV